MCNITVFKSLGAWGPVEISVITVLQSLNSKKNGHGFGYKTSTDEEVFPYSADHCLKHHSLMRLQGNRQGIFHTRLASSTLSKSPKTGAGKDAWNAFFEERRREAHPFFSEKRDFAGVHNGTLVGGPEGTMDSRYFLHKVFQYLEDKEITDEEVLAALRLSSRNFSGGAYVFVLWLDGKIYIARNGSRVLHYTSGDNFILFNTDRERLMLAAEFYKQLDNSINYALPRAELLPVGVHKVVGLGVEQVSTEIFLKEPTTTYTNHHRKSGYKSPSRTVKKGSFERLMSRPDVTNELTGIIYDVVLELSDHDFYELFSDEETLTRFVEAYLDFKEAGLSVQGSIDMAKGIVFPEDANA